jgi:colanic acid/amylovoran biosynthesis glycosyltransferase
VSEPQVTKPIVLIFKESLLPISETFIDGQARNLTRFVPRYIGLGRVKPSLAIPTDSILLSSGYSVPAKMAPKLYRRLRLAPSFHRRAAAARASLLHAHFASGGRSALPLVRRLGIPLLVTLHGSDVTARINFQQRYQDLWDKASLFVCVSEFIRRKAIDAGFPREKLHVLYTGIDHEVFQTQSTTRNRDLILFVGRLVEKKGCAFLLEAVAEVKRSHSSIQTVVIGDGPLRPSLEQLAAQLGISCQFLGAQPDTAVREWLSVARVFCAPSVTAPNGDSEGLGTVFAEAQAMGTPVVSFRHGGIPEIVLHGQTGLLATEGDSKTLASHIRHFLENERAWKDCAVGGIAWTRARFDLKRQTQLLEQVYIDLCHHRSAAIFAPLDAAGTRAGSALMKFN